MTVEAAPARGPGRPPKIVQSEPVAAAPEAAGPMFVEAEFVRKACPTYLPDAEGRMTRQTVEIKHTVPPGTIMLVEEGEAVTYFNSGVAKMTPKSFQRVHA